VYSLYSDTREPTAKMLAGLDALVIELQDVGTRIYTYVYTMANCLKAARRHGLPVFVCDRPNPIGGLGIEGEVLDERFTSFVGQYPIPMRHGMTIGELARLFNEHFGIGAILEVVPMAGWSRGAYFDDTGLSWVLPSPNLPTLDSAIVYPGTVLFEGTNVSEGRGTTRPFELITAPWVDPEPFCADLNARGLPGVHFRPVIVEPTFHKHAKLPCGGCQLHVTSRNALRPLETGIVLMEAFKRAGQDQFLWKQPPYEYEHTKMPIDILYGSPGLREGLDAGLPAGDIARGWQEEGVEGFAAVGSRFCSTNRSGPSARLAAPGFRQRRHLRLGRGRRCEVVLLEMRLEVLEGRLGRVAELQAVQILLRDRLPRHHLVEVEHTPPVLRPVHHDRELA
jgi:uncharacterized protein YbbC (DUF1343 family)